MLVAAQTSTAECCLEGANHTSMQSHARHMCDLYQTCSLTWCLLPAGAWDVDTHFRDAPFEENIPVQLGLASIWNVSFLGYPARAILPYTQALSKLAPHIQQVHTTLD